MISGVDLTVVIPTFGRHEKLWEMLRSLNFQQCAGFEVIVLDDGSPQPANHTILTEPHRSTLRILRQENQAAAAARNLGAKEANGEILLFTDDDCLPKPDWVSALSHEIKSHREALVGSLITNGLPDSRWSCASQLTIDLVYI